MEENRTWNASWIWSEERKSTTERVYFRRSFYVPSATAVLKVSVSADSRYRLYLNGRSVSIGPCKGSRYEHYYETVDLTSWLQPGLNILAADVIHYKHAEPWISHECGPISVNRSASGAFLLEGELLGEDGALIEKLHTDSKWKCTIDNGFCLEEDLFTKMVGGTERVDGAKKPHGWMQLSFNDESWNQAVVFLEAAVPFGLLSPWQLTPRPIPALRETDKHFIGLTACSGVDHEEARSWLKETGSGNKITLRIEAGRSAILELDAGELTTGTLRIEINGGRGADIRLLYSECYEPSESEPSHNAKRMKGVRDKREGGKLVGHSDVYRAAGICPAHSGADAQLEAYESFWFRAFRYVRVEIQAVDEPIDLHNIHYRHISYPLDLTGSFRCSDPELETLWTMSVRTLRNCMHETYEDTPYYEQLQYSMDTRLQMLFTYQLTADDCLPRRAIHDYHTSQLPSGMLQSRFPASTIQIIPCFSLYWIHMLAEHHLYYGDDALLRRYRPTIDALLNWFDRLLTPDGLVGITPTAYWTYFDWVDGWPRGMPPAAEKGPLALASLMYASSLQAAAIVMQSGGRHDTANEYIARAKAVNEAVVRSCYNLELGLFRDGPGSDMYCQHTQIWAVLSNAVTGEEARKLLQRMFDNKSLSIVSLPMSHELFRALEKTGLYQTHGYRQWERWRVLTRLNLTTLPETAHGTPRSDNHAWSALPIFEFATVVLGVQPAEPGYARVTVRPIPGGGLTYASGAVATTHGPVQVEWSIETDSDRFSLKVRVPDSVPVDIVLPNGERLVNAGSGSYICRWSDAAAPVSLKETNSI
jgi:alpha-L-rhamnosidase